MQCFSARRPGTRRSLHLALAQPLSRGKGAFDRIHAMAEAVDMLSSQCAIRALALTPRYQIGRWRCSRCVWVFSLQASCANLGSVQVFSLHLPGMSELQGAESHALHQSHVHKNCHMCMCTTNAKRCLIQLAACTSCLTCLCDSNMFIAEELTCRGCAVATRAAQAQALQCF